MSEVLVVRGVVDEDVSPSFWWRWTSSFGVVLTPSDIEPNGITCRVFDLSSDTPNNAILTLSSLDPNSTVSENARPLMYPTPQTAGWFPDNVGYSNFYLLSITALPAENKYGGRVLRVEFEGQLVSTLGGGIIMACFELRVRARKSG